MSDASHALKAVPQSEPRSHSLAPQGFALDTDQQRPSMSVNADFSAELIVSLNLDFTATHIFA
jgi:hypothetical protein